jgi:hypothetical protein
MTFKSAGIITHRPSPTRRRFVARLPREPLGSRARLYAS